MVIFSQFWSVFMESRTPTPRESTGEVLDHPGAQARVAEAVDDAVAYEVAPVDVHPGVHEDGQIVVAGGGRQGLGHPVGRPAVVAGGRGGVLPPHAQFTQAHLP